MGTKRTADNTSSQSSLLGAAKTEFANWLQSRLHSRGMTQAELAVRAGVSQGTVSKWFNGQSLPNLDSAQRIADALQVGPEVVRSMRNPRDRKSLYSQTAVPMFVTELAERFSSLPTSVQNVLEVQIRSVLELYTTPKTKTRVAIPPVVSDHDSIGSRDEVDDLGSDNYGDEFDLALLGNGMHILNRLPPSPRNRRRRRSDN